MIKKVLSVMLSLIIVFVMVGQTAALASETDKVTEKVVEFNGYKISVIENIKKDGTIIIDYRWDNGQTEQLIYRDNGNGINKFEVTVDGEKHVIHEDEKWNVYYDYKKISDTVVKYEPEPREDGNNNVLAIGEWHYLQTEYSSSQIILTSVAQTISYLAIAFGAGPTQIALLNVANNFIANNWPKVWFKKVLHYKINNYNYVDMLKYVYGYSDSNRSNQIYYDWFFYTSY